MSKEFKITLNSVDLGQLLDGLAMRAEAWEKTAEYHESGIVPVGFIVEECDDAEEAHNIANHYHALCQTIREQVAAQGGW